MHIAGWTGDIRAGHGEDEMTVANRITLLRILLIPVFVTFAVYYGRSVSRGESEEWLRMAAIGTFILASATDGLDGWVARRFNQKSRLGVILDPIADKGLLLAAILTLSLGNWVYTLPVWFAVLVVAREAIVVIGFGLMKYFSHPIEVEPSLMGKAATALQMVCIAWIMLQVPYSGYVVWAAAVLTAWSGAEYVLQGMRQFGSHGQPNAQ